MINESSSLVSFSSIIGTLTIGVVGGDNSGLTEIIGNMCFNKLFFKNTYQNVFLQYHLKKNLKLIYCIVINCLIT